jgi:cell division protein FtsL
MPRVITLGKGSKRRLKRIRWKLAEFLTLTLFALLIIGASALAVVWEIHHEHPYSEPVKDHQIRDAEPVEP